MLAANLTGIKVFGQHPLFLLLLVAAVTFLVVGGMRPQAAEAAVTTASAVAGDGTMYIVVKDTSGFTQSEASAYAQSTYGVELVSIHSEEVNNLILGLIQSLQSFGSNEA